MMKPHVITTRKVLPFGELSPLEFERLCLWLVEREGYLLPQHLGEAGGEQGRDVVAFKACEDGEELWYFQCKRYNRLDAPTLKKEVDKYNILGASDSARQPAGIVFVTNAAVSAAIRDDVQQHCQRFGYASVFWARTELDMLVKKRPDIIEEFFDAPRARVSSSLHQLPTPPHDFTGRAEELGELLRNVGQGGVHISGLRGMGGVGKTTLALKLAEQLIPRYPDAQFYLDLKGADPQPVSTADAMLYVIRAYDPTYRPPDNEAELQARYRSVLHGQRALLLMDNAASREQVAPLIPPNTCLLIVTSRNHFHLPRIFDRDLDTLPPADARALLLTIAPRIGEQADTIAQLCGHLPLALRLAASALAERPNLTAADYVCRLADAQKRLELVNASLSLSYDLLTTDLQKLWRALAVFPDTFDTAAAAAVWELEADAAQDALSELLKYSVLEWDETTTRYSLHDLARLYADARLSEEERGAGRMRHAAHYLGLVRQATALNLQGGEAITRGLVLFDMERANIEAGQSWAEGQSGEDDAAASLCMSYSDYGAYVLSLRLHPRERIRWLEAGLATARRLNHRAAEGRHLGNLGIAYAALGEVRRAVELHEQHLAIAREVGDRRGEGSALGDLGIAYAALGDTRRAVELYEQALIIDREIGDRRGEGNALGNLGLAYAALGDTRRAVEFYEGQLVITREIGDRHGEGTALWNMSLAFDKLGAHDKAIACAEDSLRIRVEIEDPRADKVRRALAEWRGEAGGGLGGVGG